MTSDESNINKETIRQILHEDSRKKICAKFVPRRLTDDQKQRICQDNPNFLIAFYFPCAEKCPQRTEVSGCRTHQAVTAELNAVPLEAFALFKNFLKRFNKCIQVGADYSKQK
jgi:hypothetical protein